MAAIDKSVVSYFLLDNTGETIGTCIKKQILDFSKLEARAHKKINVTKIILFLFQTETL